jgi:hypothetical protein
MTYLPKASISYAVNELLDDVVFGDILYGDVYSPYDSKAIQIANTADELDGLCPRGGWWQP